METKVVDRVKHAPESRVLESACLSHGNHSALRRDLSDTPYRDLEKLVFDGPPNQMLPKMLTGLSWDEIKAIMTQRKLSYGDFLATFKERHGGFLRTPISAADLLRARVSVCRKLQQLGLSKDELQKNPAFEFWWKQSFITGDGVLEEWGSKYKFLAGENPIWRCNPENSAQYLPMGKVSAPAFEHDKYGGERVNFLSPGWMRDSWLTLVGGDARLLDDYVETLFTLRPGYKNLMPVYSFSRDETPTVRGRLLSIGEIWNGSSEATVKDLNDFRYRTLNPETIIGV